VDLTLRDLTLGDVPAWNRLMAEVEAVDDTGEHYNEADLVEELENPALEPGDYVGAWDGERLVGYYEVRGRTAGPEFLKIHVYGATHPAHRGRGVGTVLREAMLARAAEVHRSRHPHGTARLSATGLTGNTAQESLLAQAGLLPHRWSFGMRADLGAAPAPAPLPDGLLLRPYADDLSASMLEAHNEAFLDHPNFTAWTEAEWKQWATGSRNFRPDLSRVVVEPHAPDRVVGYVQSNEYDAYFQATGRREGYVAKVGVRREHRGRGLATSLLQHCLAAYRDAGLDEASLDVDSENPTGALGVYERAGFRVERRWTDYVRDLPPVS
jgi:mycothiol synthase